MTSDQPVSLLRPFNQLRRAVVVVVLPSSTLIFAAFEGLKRLDIGFENQALAKKMAEFMDDLVSMSHVIRGRTDWCGPRPCQPRLKPIRFSNPRCRYPQVVRMGPKLTQ